MLFFFISGTFESTKGSIYGPTAGASWLHRSLYQRAWPERYEHNIQNMHFCIDNSCSFGRLCQSFALSLTVCSIQRATSVCVCVLCVQQLADEIRDVENVTIEYKEIFDLFEARRCPLLAGKPKLFFLQACRGGMTSHIFALNWDITWLIQCLITSRYK